MGNPELTNGGSSKELIHSAPRERWGGPQARISQASVPGVNGAFVSQFGKGSRMIQGSGYVQSSALGTMTLALQKLYAGIRTNQAMINATPNTYTSIDETTHSNCILVQYAPVGDVQYEKQGVNYVARMQVQFAILQQVTA